MMENEIAIYVTNTETLYLESGVVVRLYGRTEEREQDHITVEGFDPYFLVPAEEALTIAPTEHEDIETIDEGFESLRGESLAKITVSHPGAVSTLREHYDTTYSADVAFTSRLRIDQEIVAGVKAPSRRCQPEELDPIDMMVTPRVVTIDIEVDDRPDRFPEPSSERILSIVAHDNYTDEYVGFIDLNGRAVEDALPTAVETGEPPGVIDELKYESSERRMLINFASWVDHIDPDLISGWNSNGFDVPFIIDRMPEVGANPDRLSREGNASTTYDPEIVGRTCYDMMDAWESTKYQDVDTSLEAAASMELDDVGKEVVETDGGAVTTKQYGFYNLYQDDTEQFLRYNARDVELTVAIDEEAGVLDFKDSLKRIVGVDYEDTIRANDFIEMMVRRMLFEWDRYGPTATPPSDGDDDDDYDGAYTYEAFSGVAENVVGIDVSSLYPYTMYMLNASPETKVEDPDEVPDDVRIVEAPNGVKFRQDETGLFKALVERALELTEEAGRRLKAATPGTPEHERLAEEYAAKKRIRNAIYGVLGWIWFFLYDKEVAEAVTAMGQEVILRTSEYVGSQTNGKVIYGDTDSNYIKFDTGLNQETCLELAQSAVDTLNEDVYPSLAASYNMDPQDCEWWIELEMFAETFYQAGKKKRYAYNMTWEEGMAFDESIDGGKVTIKGFEFVRSDCPTVLEDLQERVIKGIIDGKPDAELREMVFQAAQRIDPADPDWDYIGIPGGFGQPLSEYTWTNGSPQTAHPRAAYYANCLLDLQLGEGDKPKRCYLDRGEFAIDGDGEQIDVIAYNSAEDLRPIEDEIRVDAQKMQRKTIRDPMQRILEPVGIDVDAALKGQSQAGLSAYL